MSENGAKKVVIVDDDEDIRDILRLVFEIEGFKVVGEAENGVVAVALAMEHRPDFMILDYMMPEQDGEKTAEIIRALHPDCRIVAFSGIITQKPHWADAFLTKDRVADILPLVKGLL